MKPDLSNTHLAGEKAKLIIDKSVTLPKVIANKGCNFQTRIGNPNSE